MDVVNSGVQLDAHATGHGAAQCNAGVGQPATSEQQFSYKQTIDKQTAPLGKEEAILKPFGASGAESGAARATRTWETT